MAKIKKTDIPSIVKDVQEMEISYTDGENVKKNLLENSLRDKCASTI